MIPENTADPLVGRQRELAELERLLDLARSGCPGVAVVHGPSGIGKSSLVEQFLSTREDFAVLRASGARWESGLAYGVLEQLAGPLAHPAEERQEDDGGTGIAGNALLAVLRRQQQERPVVVFVDNLQWVDFDSLRALLFAIRRLGSGRVLVILAVDDQQLGRLPDGYRDLLYGPLTTGVLLAPLAGPDVQCLAAAAANIELTGPAAHQLAVFTGGNPRFIRQLLEENPGGFGRDWNPSRTAPRILAQETRAALSALAARSRALIEAAAVLGVESSLIQALALAGIEVPPPGAAGLNTGPLQALDEASAAGLVTLTGQNGGMRISFPNPLLHSAVYATISPSRRAQLHLRAAGIADDEEASLFHRVAASPLPDRTLADELDAFAARQAEAGVWSAAAEALLKSSQLFPTRAGRELRLLRALDAMVGAGDLPRARLYIQEVGSFAPSPSRDAVLGYVAILEGRQTQAELLLTRAWARCNPATDAEAAALIAQRMVLHSLARWNGRDLVSWSERAVALAAQDSPAALESQAIAGLGLAASGKAEEAEASYSRLSAGPDLGAQRQRVQMGQGWLHLALDRPDTARDELAGAVPTEFSLGSFRISLWAQAWLARAEFTVGSWDDALRTVSRGVALQDSVDMDLVRPLLHWTATQIHSLRGQWGPAAEHLQRAFASSETYPIMQIPACLAKAQFAEARADYDGVLRAFEPLLRLDRTHGIDEPGFWPWQDTYANALVMVDRLAEADEFLAPLERLAAKRQHRSTMARLAYVRARLLGAQGDADAAGIVFEQGLAHLEGLHMPYARARVKFAYGQTLRRAGKRKEAAAVLSSARDLFAAMGAQSYIERCERELQASGLGHARREELDFSTLTPQEQSVAALVARGKTNKETALELYVSVKTIQYHLTRIYAKLGISSRSELAARFREPDGAELNA
jgi:DNA-binding CsgD family transcriptional regulator